MDSEAGLPLPAGSCPHPPSMHLSELSLLHVLEQMGIKYILNTIPMTVGLKITNHFPSDSHSLNFLMDLVLRNLIPERLFFNVAFLPTALNTE